VTPPGAEMLLLLFPFLSRAEGMLREGRGRNGAAVAASWWWCRRQLGAQALPAGSANATWRIARGGLVVLIAPGLASGLPPAGPSTWASSERGGPLRSAV